MIIQELDENCWIECILSLSSLERLSKSSDEIVCALAGAGNMPDAVVKVPLLFDPAGVKIVSSFLPAGFFGGKPDASGVPSTLDGGWGRPGIASFLWLLYLAVGEYGSAAAGAS